MKNFYRQLIKEGKDIKWLAHELKVSTQTVYSWRTGKSKPKIKHMQKIASVLKIDIDTVIDDFHK